MQESDSVKFLKKAPSKKLILWLVILYIATDLIALSLGVGYVLIIVGLHVLGRLAILYYQPVRRKLFTLLGIDEPSRPQMNWWRQVSIALNSIVAFSMIAFGIWIIVRNTFCQQNLICLFIQQP